MKIKQANIIAIIPARGKSRRVPKKNLVSVKGLPLLVYSIRHAKQSRLVREIYVSTDDAKIARVARAHGARVIARPKRLAGALATSESVLLHVLDQRNLQGLPDPDLVVFLQCTSPVRQKEDIDKAICLLLRKKADSLFSACRNHRLIWAKTNGRFHSLNYDYHNRQRDQEMKTQFMENGSLYVFRPKMLRSTQNRLGGRIAIYEMDPWSSFQLDSSDDARLIEWVLAQSS